MTRIFQCTVIFNYGCFAPAGIASLTKRITDEHGITCAIRSESTVYSKSRPGRRNRAHGNVHCHSSAQQPRTQDARITGNPILVSQSVRNHHGIDISRDLQARVGPP